MNKGGQLTVFIIAGLLILISAIVILVMRSKTSVIDDPGTISQREEQTVVNYLKDALRDSVLPDLRDFAISGCDNDPYLFETRVYPSDTLKIAYGYKGGVRLLTKFGAQSKYEKLVLERFKDSIDLDVFKNMNISYGEPKLDIRFSTERIITVLDYPINITVAGQMVQLDDIEIASDASIGLMLDAVTEIIDGLSLSDSAYDLSVHDFSCELLHACYVGGKYIRMVHDKPFGDDSNLVVYFATDADIRPGSCTSFDNLNGGMCA